jgi:hypothetical protein
MVNFTLQIEANTGILLFITLFETLGHVVFGLSTYEAFDRNLVRTGAAVTVVCPSLLCSTGVVYE